MESIKSLTSFKLDLPPSCIEFFPLKPEFAVIGTYNLEKQASESAESSSPKEDAGKTQSRNGSLVLVRVDGDNVYVFPY
jgi:diphthamide biosynthesis protein 7